MVFRTLRFFCVLLLIFIIESVKSYEVAPGVTYACLELHGPMPLVIHELKVDPCKAMVTLAASCGSCSGSETTSAIAFRTHAIAAINAGFFDFGVSPLRAKIIKFLNLFGYTEYHAFPVFARKIDKHWFSVSHGPTGALAWRDGGREVIFDILTTKWHITRLNDGLQLPVVDFNKPIAAGPVLYTTDYGAITPYNSDVVEVIIDVSGKVIDRKIGGGTVIPESCYVYAYHVSRTDASLHSLSVGDFLSIKHICVTENPSHVLLFEEMEYVLASTPLLIHNGRITSKVEESLSSFYTKKHPRTAVGILGDGTWLFLVVEGRQKRSVGVTLKMLADYMKKRGCVFALNLGGGGSSTLVIYDMVINKVAGREHTVVRKEQPVSDVLLIMKRKLEQH